MPIWLYDLLVNIGGATPWFVITVYLLVTWRRANKEQCEESLKVLRDRVDLAERQTVDALHTKLEALRSELETAYAEVERLQKQQDEMKKPSSVSLQAIRKSLDRIGDTSGDLNRYVMSFAQFADFMSDEERNRVRLTASKWKPIFTRVNIDEDDEPERD